MLQGLRKLIKKSLFEFILLSFHVPGFPSGNFPSDFMNKIWYAFEKIDYVFMITAVQIGSIRSKQKFE